VCENAVAQPKTCDFTTGKIILQQEISREQLAKLLTEGKTDLLTGFKSARTGRNFKAFLVKQPDGKIGFEFEPRGEGKGKPGAKT
ncbi:topoisomerase C-terminal repeat-containing protein, partial [Escherichia coli]